jgi:hypothetical protein
MSFLTTWACIQELMTVRSSKGYEVWLHVHGPVFKS